MKISLIGFTFLFILTGCTAKEINNNIDSITSDVVKAFEDSKDKSAE